LANQSADVTGWLMGHGNFNTLHEREKAVLRLLLQGFDVKASAQELDVTPNVINERLRDVRRKLGVTSSREAARLLAAQETQRDNFFVDRKIGLAGSVEATAFQFQPDSRAEETEAYGGSMVREQQASFFASPSVGLGISDRQRSPWTFSALPLRERGERRNGLSKQQRILAIIDLSTKLAAAFALVCLISVVLSSLTAKL
jgi:DNA-binding CsgD family transcriptional regulator